MTETVWYKCRKCGSTTNALPGSKMYESIGGCDTESRIWDTYAGVLCAKCYISKLERENEQLKARILRLEERIAELTRNQ